MTESDDKRYTIGEVADKTGVALHVLRQWERKFPQLKPKRNRAGRRYYTAADIEIVRQIHYLVRHEKMTLAGASVRLTEILAGHGRPKTSQAAQDLLDALQNELRAMIHLLDSV